MALAQLLLKRLKARRTQLIADFGQGIGQRLLLLLQTLTQAAALLLQGFQLLAQALPLPLALLLALAQLSQPHFSRIPLATLHAKALGELLLLLLKPAA